MQGRAPGHGRRLLTAPAERGPDVRGEAAARHQPDRDRRAGAPRRRHALRRRDLRDRRTRIGSPCAWPRRSCPAGSPTRTASPSWRRSPSSIATEFYQPRSAARVNRAPTRLRLRAHGRGPVHDARRRAPDDAGPRQRLQEHFRRVQHRGLHRRREVQGHDGSSAQDAPDAQPAPGQERVSIRACRKPKRPASPRTRHSAAQRGGAVGSRRARARWASPRWLSCAERAGRFALISIAPRCRSSSRCAAGRERLNLDNLAVLRRLLRHVA